LRHHRNIQGTEPAPAGIEAVQVDILYSQLRWSLGANLLVGALLVGGIWGAADPRRLALWASLLVGVMVARAVLGLFYYRRHAQGHGPAYWRTLHLLLIFASGAVWGAAAPLFFVDGEALTRVVVAFALVGMGAGAVSSLAAVRWAYSAYLLPTMLPLAGILLASGEPGHLPVGGMAVVYVVVMLGMAWRLHNTLAESLRLSSSNEELTSNLETTVSQLVSASHSRDVIERAARESQRRLRMYIEQTPLATIDWDAEFKVAAWNPAAEATFGYSRAEALGRHALDLLAPSHRRDELWLLWLDLLRRQGGTRWTGDIRTKDGRVIVCEWYNTPLLDAEGNVFGVSSLVQDVTERREAERQIQRLANFDVLTGLPNRNLFHDRFAVAIERAKRRGLQLALLFIDLDNFKVINDTLGHAAGDRLLQHVADALRRVAREEDTVARLSGDEFVVLMEVAKPLEVTGAVERLRAGLGEPLALEGQELAASATVGIALYPEDGQDMVTLEKNADTAMYRAKEQSEPFQFFHQEMAARSQERLIIETNLRRAMEREQLFLSFQPIVDLQSGALGHAEALLRWHHPNLGLVPPDRFIPIAEASGLILSLGEWVLRAACRQLRRWQQEGMPPLRIAVNVSARQLRQHDLAEQFVAILREEGVTPGQIGVELTESALMQNADEAVAILHSLRAHGFEISVDDFGTGYSSLSYLKRFPIDKLKIDRSFVKDLSAGSGSVAIVTAVLGVARALEMRVVAEGIETREQMDLLRAQGCELGQGYHIARPLPADEFAAWARRFKSPHSAVSA
jgi:diguanylate cyclase (GGDEF)-like protein/PAS domain S-box-containing protein